MVERIEGINPTRMELLRLKKRVKLAEKGHKLLKEKRDALIMEFFNILEEAKNARKVAEEKLMEAYKALIIAEAYIGTQKVIEASYSIKKEAKLEFFSRSIMGVRVPVLEVEDPEITVLDRGYGLSDTSILLDDACKKFEKALEAVVKLAEIERAIYLLAEEIEKTKRRVNSLENIILPRLRATVKYIKMRLDEMERESFFRLKRIKSMIEKRGRAMA